MKTKLFNFILLGTLLMTGVVSAAWEAPLSSFPNGDASAPVHTGDFEQRKSGGFWAQYMHAGTSATTNKLTKILSGTVGFLAGDKTVLAPTGIFKQVFLPGKNSHLRVGTTQEDNIGSALYNAASDSNRAPAVIDLQKRSGSHSVDAVALLKNTNVCTTDLAIVTNTPAIHFWSDKNGASADLIARQIRLSGGNPTSGSVLVSVDSQGNAVWGKPKMVKDGTGWVLAYDYDKSPAQLGQLVCETPIEIDVCTNLNGSQSTVPAGMLAENGQCFVDVCTNVNGLQKDVPSGFAGITWTANSKMCAPTSCDTNLIGTQNLGVTVIKGNDCPVEREWLQMATPPVLDNNPLLVKSPGNFANKSCSLFYKDSQYDISENGKNLRVVTRYNSGNPTPLGMTDFNKNNNQLIFMSYKTRIFGGTLPNPNITQQGNCLYKAVIGANVSCQVLPYGTAPEQDTWNMPRLPFINGKPRTWFPAHSCMETRSAAPSGSGHGKVVTSFEQYDNWIKNNPGNNNVPEIKIESTAYSMEYLFPKGANNLQYFK